jgi:hypothetical protein
VVVDVVAGVPSVRASQVVARAGAVAALLAGAAAFTVASHTASTAAVVGVLGKYSPERLAAGRVWTVPLSVFLLGHPRMVGSTTIFVVFLFLPFALWRGIARAGVVAMAGHVVSTLVVATVVLPAAALGVAGATGISRALDDGASAALAACAGGLAVAIGRRAPELGAAMLGAVAAWFLLHLAVVSNPSANVADVEHLLALGTGAIVEWRLPMPPRSSPRHSGPGA